MTVQQNPSIRYDHIVSGCALLEKKIIPFRVADKSKIALVRLCLRLGRSVRLEHLHLRQLWAHTPEVAMYIAMVAFHILLEYPVSARHGGSILQKLHGTYFFNHGVALRGASAKEGAFVV